MFLRGRGMIVALYHDEFFHIWFEHFLCFSHKFRPFRLISWNEFFESLLDRLPQLVWVIFVPPRILIPSLEKFLDIDGSIHFTQNFVAFIVKHTTWPCTGVI